MRKGILVLAILLASNVCSYSVGYSSGAGPGTPAAASSPAPSQSK